MRFTVKLFSSLMEYLPQDAEGNTVEINSDTAISCEDIVARYRIPPEIVRVAMVNGEFLPPEKRGEALQDGDTISIWPSIQGG